MSMCRAVSWVVGRGGLLWPVCSLDKNSASLCPASFCTPRPNLPVVPGIPWLPTFAFQSSRWRTRGTRDQIANIHWIMEKARVLENICFIGYAKVFDCVDHNKLENSSRDRNTRPSNLPPDKSVCRSRSNSWNWAWNNRLIPNRKRSTSRPYIVTLLI